MFLCSCWAPKTFSDCGQQNLLPPEAARELYGLSPSDDADEVGLACHHICIYANVNIHIYIEYTYVYIQVYNSDSDIM